MSDRPELSIVTTLYRSEATIAEFVRRSIAAAEKITRSFEIVIVDDGSPDSSLSLAVGMVEKDPRIKVVELSRNFGHHKALMTGLMHAKGEYCFLIDSDLEESPELLIEFWNKRLETKKDVIFGYQKERAGDWKRRLTGRIAYWLFRLLLSGIEVPPNHITVRLMSRPFVDALISHREQKTAIGGLWIITGFHQQGIAVEKGVRRRPSYTFATRWHNLIDSITSFSEVPLIGIFYLGMLVSLFAGTATIYLLSLHLLGLQRMQGWVSVMLSIWLIGGLLIFCVGIIGIYISKIFIETKQRPYTIVRKIYRSSQSTTGDAAGV